MTHSLTQELSFGVLGKGSGTSRLESQGELKNWIPGGQILFPQFSHLSRGGIGLGLTSGLHLL